MSKLKLIFHEDDGKSSHFNLEWKDGTDTLPNILKDGQRGIRSLVELIALRRKEQPNDPPAA